MDKKDEKILEQLEQNGRKSYTKIAEELDVSEGTIRNRIKKLKENNIIEKFTVQINKKQKVEAYVNVQVSTQKPFSQITEKIPDNLEVSEVAGDVDMVIKISRNTPNQINKAVDQIRAIDGVKSTKTYMVLSNTV